MKILFCFILILCTFKISFGQVPKKIIVEHFTNTVCSVCATRNPGFYTNLTNQSNSFHLAIHPSSPYSSCLLNQHNVTENDARTNYYGIYGATPRLVIQGTVISPSANYSSSAIFNPYLSEQSPIQLTVNQQKFDSDSIRSQIVIKTVSAHSLANASLFVALAEDTLAYTGPNGESHHYDVLRKSITPTVGLQVNIPSIIGDSSIYTFTTAAHAGWDFNRIFTIAILQETATKEVIQVEAILATSNTFVSSVNEQNSVVESLVVFVINGTHNYIEIHSENDQNPIEFNLYDLFGRKVLVKTITNAQTIIDIHQLTRGFYVYSIIQNNEITQSGKLVVE